MYPHVRANFFCVLFLRSPRVRAMDLNGMGQFIKYQPVERVTNTHLLAVYLTRP